MQRLDRAGFTMSAQGDGLLGTTDEQKPFPLDLTPAGGNALGSVIVIGP